MKYKITPKCPNCDVRTGYGIYSSSLEYKCIGCGAALKIRQPQATLNLIPLFIINVFVSWFLPVIVTVIVLSIMLGVYFSKLPISEVKKEKRSG